MSCVLWNMEIIRTRLNTYKTTIKNTVLCFRGINIKHPRSSKLLHVKWIFEDRRQEYKYKNRNHRIMKIGSQNPIFYDKGTK
jgi:hypothetical protein